MSPRFHPDAMRGDRAARPTVWNDIGGAIFCFPAFRTQDASSFLDDRSAPAQPDRGPAAQHVLAFRAQPCGGELRPLSPRFDRGKGSRAGNSRGTGIERGRFGGTKYGAGGSAGGAHGA